MEQLQKDLELLEKQKQKQVEEEAYDQVCACHQIMIGMTQCTGCALSHTS